jgi:predicted oxidoreductase (fatty acid repression mutant protein)
MSATTFATLSALEVILFGENHKAVFKIVKRTLAVFHFHFTKTISTQAIAVLQSYVLTFFTIE